MRIGLFITCLTDTFFPRVGEAVVRVLRHFGCEVEFPDEQTCCGQPAYNSGFPREAAVAAEGLIRAFEPYEHVVTPSASCAAMVREHYAELFANDAKLGESARKLAGRTHEFLTFLTDTLQVDVAGLLKIESPTTWHYPCHARALYSPADLEASLGEPDAGRPLRAPQRVDLCCGFGGAFSVEFPEVSGAMLRDKLDVLCATGARQLVCNEAGCAMQIGGGLKRRGQSMRVRHVAELLAESLGLMER